MKQPGDRSGLRTFVGFRRMRRDKQFEVGDDESPIIASGGNCLVSILSLLMVHHYLLCTRLQVILLLFPLVFTMLSIVADCRLI
jgi:hypothetical protein